MKLLILDLDGTVRIKKGGVIGEFESGFINSPTDQEIIPGAMSAIKKYHSEGWVIVGCSNQGGVAAGHKSLDNCILEQARTLILVPMIDKIYFCPDYEGNNLGVVSHKKQRMYTPKINQGLYRKPNPGMVWFALDYYSVVVSVDEVLMVGDHDTDEQCAIAAGVPFQWAKDWWY